MKTSNKLLVAACLVLVIALAFYNTALRAEYRAGTFRDPFKDFVTLPTQDFDAVDVEAASLLGVRIEPGPCRVRVYEPLTEVLRLSQHGHRLTLALRFPHDARSYHWAGRPAVVITCPSLSALRTNATYSVNGHPATDRAQPPYNDAPVLVQGFRQDSLLVRADNGSRVELLGTTLHQLRVMAHNGAPVLRLHPGNHIQRATFTMGGQSHLLLDELSIPDLRYHFADSAVATLPGRALSALTAAQQRP